jgi:hypothetical protein
VPRDQLPAFISQLRRIATQKVNSWNDRYNSMAPEMKKNYPWSMGNREVKVPDQGGGGKPPQEMTTDDIQAELARIRRLRGQRP